MKNFWLFRSNLPPLEYYHEYKTLEEFKEKCHDFWLLQGIWFLENDKFDEVIIWRLKPKQPIEDFTFEVKGKKFIQRFVHNFGEVFKHPKPHTTMFRGGFSEYDEVTKQNPDFFGLKLYVGAGKRIYPQYGGKYDKILVESDKDLHPDLPTVPFYKTASPNIFYPLDDWIKDYDLCWICNFKQITQKGQEWFLKILSEDDYLKSLQIIHVGNLPQRGAGLCKKYGIDNITFAGSVDRPILNKLINSASLGILTSNMNDGCPRVLTEMMCTGIPVLVREEMRVLGYYKRYGYMSFNENTLSGVCQMAMKRLDYLREETRKNIQRLSVDSICSLNLSIWNP